MIYFIRDEATQHIKIGFTKGYGKDRLRELQTGCLGQLILLLEIRGSKQDETAWHDRFEAVRERGEWFRPVPELLQAIEEMKAAQAETVRRALSKLQEMDNSGVGWTDDEIISLRMLQIEEERQKLTARVRKVRKLVDALGPVVAFRQLHGILNALEMQVEDGNYHRRAVARLCEALLATAELYHIPKFLTKQLEEAIRSVKGDIQDI